MRRKMLSLILLLIFCPFFKVDGINLTYIVKKDDNTIHPSCITEETERYAAVGWIYPIPNNVLDLPNITHKFYPNIENDYNCQFSKHTLCSTRWSLRDWIINETSSRTRDVLFDNRWEDLPPILITNSTKEFSERIELGNIPKIVFSVRSDGITELFLCSGWNPNSYACYYFNINYKEIYFNTYHAIPKDMKENYKTSNIQHYRAQSNILSHDEWRTFSVHIMPDGLVTLTDLNLNRILIEATVKDYIQPLYMFMKSSNSSLWKIHQNYFLSTNTSQISRLGPRLDLLNKDLCISLMVSTCDSCEMTFFYQNGTVRKVLKIINPMKTEEWKEIKLKEENVQFENINLFVQTALKESKNTSGFWAIDNVRVCNENEVKVSFLNTKTIAEKLTEEEVSCQIIKSPNWRPKKYVYSKIKDFPEVFVTKNTNSLTLKWTQEDTSGLISYFIWYQANDICSSEPYNLHRIKSNGFVTTKMSEIVLENLIPFTAYNITVSSILHETDKKMIVNTLETEEPTLDELPSKIQVRAPEKSLDNGRVIHISWDKVNCSSVFGRLIYTVLITDNLNFTKVKTLQTDNSYEFDGLQPFRQYTLKIFTARNGRNMHNNLNTNIYVLNFTTSAGVAPPPKNVELYSIDNHSASLRYEIPSAYKGLVRELQVKKCMKPSSSKCKSISYPITPCPFWFKKYCVEVINLISSQTYSFKVSLKNANSDVFGEEAEVEGYTNERVPGQPTNITYKFVDCLAMTHYCNLNITWTHPYQQNSTISSFEIILENIEKHKESEDDKKIQEVYKVINNTYYADYNYQIRYIPYSTQYNLSLRSTNAAYFSEFTNITLRTDNIGDHIDQSPKLIGRSDSTLIFKIPHLDPRLNFYKLTIVVQDFNVSKKIDEAVLKNKAVSKDLCHNYGDTWISQVLTVTNNMTDNIMIGNNNNDHLKPNTKYCITFIVTNNYKNSDHDVIYYEKLKTSIAVVPNHTDAPSSSRFNHLYMLFLLLLLVPIGFIIYKYLNKKKIISRSAEQRENVYESLPFDDCDSNCVTNENYDKLVHK